MQGHFVKFTYFVVFYEFPRNVGIAILAAHFNNPNFPSYALQFSPF